MHHRNSHTTAAVAVLTVSDSRSLQDDTSGAIVMDSLTAAGHTIASREIVRDVQTEIVSIVSIWAADNAIHAIIVTGGTGPSKRDITPNAIIPLLSSTLPGFGELFRQLSYEEIGSAAFLSRAEAGWIDNEETRTPIFLLPGAPKAVSLALDRIIIPQLGHLLDVCSWESKR